MQTTGACNAQGEEVTELLMAPGKLADKIAGISGTRNLADNLSDLKAQASGNIIMIEPSSSLFRDFEGNTWSEQEGVGHSQACN